MNTNPSASSGQVFLTQILLITQRGFSQLCVLVGGFSRCEHLRKPAALVHRVILQCPIFEAD
jgi:hypothetical protein